MIRARVGWLLAAACLPAAAQTWDPLGPSGTFPAPRQYAVAALDPGANQMIVFGGTADYSEGYIDVWRLSLSGNFAWTPVQPAGTLPSYGASSAVYDAANSRLIVFGGLAGGPGGTILLGNQASVLSNTIGVNGTPTWSQLNPIGGPPAARDGHSAVYDATNNRMIVFGGFNGSAHLNDVWVLSNANGLGGTPTWTPLSPAGNPPAARATHNAVYDAANNRMIIFGGSTANVLLNDVWVLSNANGLGGTPTWTPLSPAGVPPAARVIATAAFDPITDELILFGGASTASALGDVWTLSNANGIGGTPAWTPRSFTGNSPAARYGAAGVYNPTNRELLIFGGYTTFNSLNTNLNDTWILDDANFAPAADLVITSLTGPPSLSGTQINASAILANNGNAAAISASVEYYWSRTATIGTGNIDSGWGCTFASIAVANTANCNGTIGVPATLGSGYWYLSAIADPSLALPELSKTNNGRLADTGPVLIPATSVSCNISSMTFSYAPGGAAPPPQTCTVNTSPSGFGIAAAASTLTGGNWLNAALSPSGNPTAAPATLAVSVNSSGLAPGTYNGNVTIQSTGGGFYNIPVSLTVTQPRLSISKSHTGIFSVGQQGTYTVTVSNGAGAAPSSGAVTVTENPPSGLTVVSMSGTGWTCPNGGNTCTRSDPLNGNSSYQPITVTVNVLPNSTSPQINSVSVSGGGSSSATATDSTFIAGGTTVGGTAYLIGTVAGGGLPATPAQALNVAFGFPVAVTVDANHNYYLSADNCVFKVDPNNTITRVAGVSTVRGYSGDGGPATSAQLNYPERIAIDSVGNIYFADESNSRVRKVTIATGIITTIAGNGTFAYSGDGGPATSASLNFPVGLAFDGAGNLYIADAGNNRIRRVAAGTGVITTVVGNGAYGYFGDGGPAINSRLANPLDVQLDSAGNLYIADWNNNRIRKVTASNGIISTIAGNGVPGFSGDGQLAIFAELNEPFGVAVDAAGNIFIADSENGRIRKVTASTGVISTFAGNGDQTFGGDNGPASNAALGLPEDVAVDTSGNVYIADWGNSRIRRVSPASGTIVTIAGGATGFAGDGLPATSGQLSFDPLGITLDSAGNLYIGDNLNNRVRMVSAATGIISTIAGTGVANYSGDNGPAASAQINNPVGVAVDSHGNVYIADNGNHRVRKVAAGTGTITTYAGNGTQGFFGEGVAATSAELNHPFGLAIDGLDNLFIVDAGNNRIRKVAAGTGIITTVAGNGNAGYSGDHGLATNASINSPSGVAVDEAGNIFIGDADNNVIREVAAGTNIITTVAGNGFSGYFGDGGLAVNAEMTTPEDVKVENGTLFIADFENENIRTVNLSSGIISTLAGAGTNISDLPVAVALGRGGAIFVAESTESGGLVTLLNDSGAPLSQILPGNAGSSDHLTFNLLIKNSSQGQQGSIAHNASARRQHTQLAPQGTGGSGNGVTVGGTVQFTQTLARDASAPTATNVTVGSTLPPSWTITGCTTDSGGTCSPTGGSEVTVTYPTLTSTQTPTLTLIADEQGGDTSVQLDTSSSSASANLATASAAQILRASPGTTVLLNFGGPTSVAAGATITYNVILNNGSTAKLAGDPLTVTITPDASLTGVTVTDPSWTCTHSATLVCTNTAAVAAGGQLSFPVSGTAPTNPNGSALTTTATLTFGGQTSAAQTVNTSVGQGLPSAPALLAPANGAIGVSPTTSLTWSAASGATSYAVYFGITNPPALVVPSTSLLTYSVGTLASNTTYYWKIASNNSSGSTASSIWSFTTGTPGGCTFTLASTSASLPSAGTSTTTVVAGGALPQNPVTVNITPGAGCGSGFAATSSAPWLAATSSGNSFTYTAHSNAHSTSQSATLTIANVNGGSQTFTVTEAGDSETLQNRQVRALYFSILGRDPDSAGFAFWTTTGAAGLGQMADSFLTSPESFNSDFAVVATYQAATGAVPSYTQFLTSVAAVRSGAQTIAQLYTALITGNSTYSATTLYQNLLARAPTGSETASAGNTPASWAAWCQTLIAYPAYVTPADATNNEFQSTGTYRTTDHTNAMYIAMLYYTILDRDLDGAGYNFWVGVANSGGPGVQFQGGAGGSGYPTRIQILGPGTPNQGFIGSPEFQGLYQ